MLSLLIDVHLNLDNLKDIALSPWNFDKLPGNNPQNWPVGLEELLEKLGTLPPLFLFNEPFDLSHNFKSKSRLFIRNCVSNIKNNQNLTEYSADIKNLMIAIKIIFSLSFQTGSFVEIVNKII